MLALLVILVLALNLLHRQRQTESSGPLADAVAKGQSPPLG